MNRFYAFDVKDYLLPPAVWFTCTVQAEFTLPGVKAEKSVRRSWLIFVRVQSNNIPVKCSNNPHILNKEYDTSYIHAITPHGVPLVGTLVTQGTTIV